MELDHGVSLILETYGTEGLTDTDKIILKNIIVMAMDLGLAEIISDSLRMIW